MDKKLLNSTIEKDFESLKQLSDVELMDRCLYASLSSEQKLFMESNNLKIKNGHIVLDHNLINLDSPTKFYYIGSFMDTKSMRNFIDDICRYKIKKIMKINEDIFIVLFDIGKEYRFTRDRNNGINNYFIITNDHKRFIKIPCDSIKEEYDNNFINLLLEKAFN